MIQDSTAIRKGLAHIEAWSHHDWDKTRALVSSTIHAVVTTPEPRIGEMTGVDQYMERKKRGAQLVEPGSVKVISAIGDEHNALILATMRIGLGPGGTMVTMVRAMLFSLDENKKIKEERDEWFTLSE